MKVPTESQAAVQKKIWLGLIMCAFITFPFLGMIFGIFQQRQADPGAAIYVNKVPVSLRTVLEAEKKQAPRCIGLNQKEVLDHSLNQCVAEALVAQYARGIGLVPNRDRVEQRKLKDQRFVTEGRFDLDKLQAYCKEKDPKAAKALSKKILQEYEDADLRQQLLEAVVCTQTYMTSELKQKTECAVCYTQELKPQLKDASAMFSTSGAPKDELAIDKADVEASQQEVAQHVFFRDAYATQPLKATVCGFQLSKDALERHCAVPKPSIEALIAEQPASEIMGERRKYVRFSLKDVSERKALAFASGLSPYTSQQTDHAYDSAELCCDAKYSLPKDVAKAVFSLRKKGQVSCPISVGPKEWIVFQLIDILPAKKAYTQAELWSQAEQDLRTKKLNEIWEPMIKNLRKGIAENDLVALKKIEDQVETTGLTSVFEQVVPIKDWQKNVPNEDLATAGFITKKNFDGKKHAVFQISPSMNVFSYMRLAQTSSASTSKGSSEAKNRVSKEEIEVDKRFCESAIAGYKLINTLLREELCSQCVPAQFDNAEQNTFYWPTCEFSEEDRIQKQLLSAPPTRENWSTYHLILPKDPTQNLLLYREIKRLPDDNCKRLQTVAKALTSAYQKRELGLFLACLADEASLKTVNSLALFEFKFNPFDELIELELPEFADRYVSQACEGSTSA